MYNPFFKLNEDAISVGQASKQNIAFISVKQGNYIRGYLYKPGKTPDKSVIIGFGEMSREPENPYNAFDLERTAAEKGYGPLLYDIMLSIAEKNGSPVMPDRYSVSKYASNVWKFYHDRRSDVVYSPIDDKKNPLTKTKSDDGDVHFKIKGDDINKRNPVDDVYWIKKPVNYSSLLGNHKEYLQQSKVNPKEFNDILKSKAENFFHTMYGRNY